MPTPTRLAAQLTACCVTHTASAAAAWAAALHHLPPEGLQAIAETMPPDAMGKSLRGQLETLAYDRRTAPFDLGSK